MLRFLTNVRGAPRLEELKMKKLTHQLVDGGCHDVTVLYGLTLLKIESVWLALLVCVCVSNII